MQDTPISPQDPRYKGDKSEYIKKAREHGLKENYKVVVIGHTHEPGLFDFKDIVVMNSGTCQCGHLQYAIIGETDTGELYYRVVVEKR
jgi:predicted phosphodiesterase